MNEIDSVIMFLEIIDDPSAGISTSAWVQAIKDLRQEAEAE